MRKHFWLILIIIGGTILRYYHNTDISLWHDEAFSALLIKYSWGEMFYRIGLDVHPPAYYVFLRGWHYIFGDSLLSLRSFSVFFGVATIWVGWLFVKEAFKDNHRSALIAAGLIALNPFQIQYATEARMYTFGAFFVILASYFLVKTLNLQKVLNEDKKLGMPNLPLEKINQRQMLWSLVGFTGSIVIMIYTHYYLLFAAAAICFYAFFYLLAHHHGNWKKFIPILISCILILISYLPWLKTFLFQYGQVGAGYWIPAMDIWSIPSTLYTLLVGFGHDVNQSSVQKLLIIIFILTIFVLFKFLRKTQSFHKWLVFFVTLAPFIGALIFLVLAKLKGSGSSVYLVRYFIFTGAFLSIIVGVWLSEIKNKWLSLVLIACYLFLNFFAFQNYWSDLKIETRLGMNQASRYLKANMEPNHKLYAGSSFMFFNLKYYANRLDFQKPLLFSGGNADIKNLPHFAGTAILTNDDLLPDFTQEVKNSDTVWLVWTNGFGASKPPIPSNWAQIMEKEYLEVRPYLGASIFVSEYKVN